MQLKQSFRQTAYENKDKLETLAKKRIDLRSLEFRNLFTNGGLQYMKVLFSYIIKTAGGLDSPLLE